MKLWSHTLVRNEERYIWFALRSVVDHVDKMLVWDTGSDDNTVNIIKEFKKIYPKKVEFKEVGNVDSRTYTQKRQEMLERTRSDWFMILDGDEVWWKDSIETTVSIIKKHGKDLDSIVNPYFNLVGDVFHYQSESAGQYQIDDRKGHVTIRFMNRIIPGLYTSKPHGQHGYFDKDDVLIQDRDKKRRKHLDAPFMHFTHMLRSSSWQQDQSVIKRDIKFKYELGKTFPKDQYYPEAFFIEKPSFVPTPWKKRDFNYLNTAGLMHIPKIVKRKLWKGSSGY